MRNKNQKQSKKLFLKPSGWKPATPPKPKPTPEELEAERKRLDRDLCAALLSDDTLRISGLLGDGHHDRFTAKIRAIKRRLEQDVILSTARAHGWKGQK